MYYYLWFKMPEKTTETPQEIQLSDDGLFINQEENQEGKKEFRFKIVTDKINRNGWMYHPNTMSTVNFMKNPVFLAQHNSWTFPIGKVNRIEKSEKAMYAIVEFHGETDESILFEKLYERKFLNAVSIGVKHISEVLKPLPKNLLGKVFGWGEGSWGEGKNFKDIVKSELRELSGVVIPAEPDAVLKDIIKNSDDFTENDLICFNNIMSTNTTNIDKKAELNNISTNHEENMTTEETLAFEAQLAAKDKRILELESNLDESVKNSLLQKDAKIKELETDIVTSNESTNSLKAENKKLLDEKTTFLEAAAKNEETIMTNKIDAELTELTTEGKITPAEKDMFSAQLLILNREKTKQDDMLMADVIMNSLKQRTPNVLKDHISGSSGQQVTGKPREIDLTNMNHQTDIHKKALGLMDKNDKLEYSNACIEAIDLLKEGK